MVNPTAEERDRRETVLDLVRRFILDNRRIPLPAFDGSGTAGEYALSSLPPNDFSGQVSGYCYQLEGEEDLLHLIVSRCDGLSLTVEEGQAVAGFVLAGVSPAMIWLRPGEMSQHFYFGHDELLRT